MPTKPKPNKRPDGTINKLSAALQVGKRRVAVLLAEGMPDDVKGAQAWRTAREADDTTAGLRRERIGLVRAQREKAEIENKRARGELISRRQAEAWQTGTALAVQAMLRRFEMEIPVALLGLPLERSRPYLKKFVREIQQRVHDGDAEFWASCPHTETAI